MEKRTAISRLTRHGHQNGRQGLAALLPKAFCGLRNGEASGSRPKGLDDLARMRWIVHYASATPQ